MSHAQLLTREDFRNGVFARDNYKCVVCEAPAVDAHHIIERRLFTDGGYYLANGVSVCEAHHIACESTEISLEDIREYAGIKEICLPSDMYGDVRYDKWGNVLLEDGTRTMGPLAGDASVRKVMGKNALSIVSRVKYPRTFHLPWSPGATKDDRILPDTSYFEGKRVVITEKMDGENTTMYSDYMHARSLEYDQHPSRSYAKRVWANKVAGQLPYGWRVCGENLWAKHSIHYVHLLDQFQMFSVWDENNVCLSDHETRIWAGLLGLRMPRTVWFGEWDEKYVRDVMLAEYNDYYSKTKVKEEAVEGYVVRLADSFEFKDYKTSVAKYVRESHVTTGSHWKHQRIVKNLTHQEWLKERNASK